jgi:hypothetical protein
MKITLLFCLVLCATGCSNKAAYQNLKLNKQQQCRQAPASEYDRCMREMEQSYEEYERQRQHTIKQ